MSTFTNREQETVFAGSSFIAETTCGTEPSTGTPTPFSTLNVLPSFVKNVNDVTVQGFTLPVGVTYGAESSTWSGEGQLNVSEIGFFTDVVSDTKSTPNSYTLYHKLMKANGCAISGFSISGDTQQITSSVSFVGKKIQKMTAEKTVGSITPPIFYDPMATTVKLNGSSTRLKLNQWSVEVSDLWNIANFINAEDQNIIQVPATGNFSLTLPLESGAYDYLISKSKNSAIISNTTAIGDDEYTFTIEFDFFWDAPDTPGDTNGVWTIGLKGKIINKTTKAIEITHTEPTD